MIRKLNQESIGSIRAGLIPKQASVAISVPLEAAPPPRSMSVKSNTSNNTKADRCEAVDARDSPILLGSPITIDLRCEPIDGLVVIRSWPVLESVLPEVSGR